MLREDEVRDRLRTAIADAGGQQQFAMQHGFKSVSYVSDVLRGKRALADRILATIGVVRETVYREVEHGR